MAANIDLCDFEWEKHRPSWGEIPTARANHFAFVHKNKMYIMGGETSGAPPDGSVANNIPYLDLSNWTWGRQKMSGPAPTTGILRANCVYIEETETVQVTVGPRWEAGTQQVIDVYTLYLDSFRWLQKNPRGRWNINWKMESTSYIPKNGKLVQFGRNAVSNFNDQLTLSASQLDSMAWTPFYELTRLEKNSCVLAAVTVGQDRLAVFMYDPENGTSSWAQFDVAQTSVRLAGSGGLQRTGGDSVAPVTIGNSVFLFDTAMLCLDRVATIKLDNLVDPAVTESRFIKSTNRAPQKARYGASAVYHDGYIIFFGGALSKELGTKYTNEVYILTVGVHNSIETILDKMAVEDASPSDKDEDAEEVASSAPITDVVELDSDKKSQKKEKKEKKKVGFADTANVDLESSGAIEKPTEASSSSSSPEPSNPLSTEASSSSTIDTNTKEKTPENTEKDSTTESSTTETNSDKAKSNDVPKPPEPEVQSKPLPPEERVLKYLDDNQANTIQLLKFAVNNPDCYPDMAFKVNGKIFWAHKSIISARSSRWRQHLDTNPKTTKASPSSARRSSSDLEDSQLDVSTESAIPKEKSSPSPFMFGRLGASAIDLMLDEEEDSRPKFEMIPLPPRYSTIDSYLPPPAPRLAGPPPPPHAVSPAISTSSSSVPSTVSSTDSIQSSPSASGIAPPAKSVPAYTVDDLDDGAFLKVLGYMYTGQLQISISEAENIGDVAHEFLLDEVSAVCREKTNKIHSEPPLKLSRTLRKLVGSAVGSDYFFVVRHKKLFAHRVLIFLFSSHFRKLMLTRAEKSYLEVREVEDNDMPVEAFIDFCRMMYSNFTAVPEHAEKKMDVASISRLATDWHEHRCLSLIHSTKPDAKSTLEMFRLSAANPVLLRDVRRNILTHFGKFAQNKSVVKKLTKDEQVAWLHLGDLGGATWLDKMWFAHSIGDTSLLADAETNLGNLINVENVLPVLFCAHQVGMKSLRSLCMDFMSAHSTSIEDARRMQMDAPMALGKVAGLSASLNHELTTKLSTATSSAKGPVQKVKSCGICSKTFSTFGKKNNCILCHKVACSDCTKKKVTIPPIFGIAKPRDICVLCAQVVDLWTDPATKSQ